MRVNQNKLLEEFFHKLGATAKMSSRSSYYYKPQPQYAYDAVMTQFPVEEVPMVEMELRLSKLVEIAETLYDIEQLQHHYGPEILLVGQQVMLDNMSRRKESRIRSTNPAVQKAWEHYQTMLNLVRNDE